MTWTPTNKPLPPGEGRKPTKHETMADSTVAGLTLWFETELSRLEKKYADFVTPSAVRKSLNR